MDNYLEKEFSIGEIMSLTINRNDFDDLGSVLEMKISHILQSSHIITISFYTEEKEQINQKSLLLLCNYENTLFDNVLLISSLLTKNESDYRIKLLNKEIKYMKIYISAAYNPKGKNSKVNQYNFAQIFDVKNLVILSQEEISELNLTGGDGNSVLTNGKEKNENLTLILSELDKVNQSLISEKEKIDNEKRILADKEEKISKIVVDFKKEMFLFGDKCYGECLNEVNSKIYEINKKLQNAENNIMNKYKIIKEKLKNNNNNNLTTFSNSANSINYKEKNANLEIKIKFLEDTNNSLKLKISEKDEKIKSYSLNEEKMNKMIKKLKDEIVLLNSQIKEKEKKEKEVAISIQQSKLQNSSNSSNIKPTKKNKNLISYEIKKTQIQNYTTSLLKELSLLSLSLDNYNSNNSDKEITIISLLLMNLVTNPINLYNKFDYAIILIMLKLKSFFHFGQNSSFSLLISSSMNELYNKLSEFKSSLSNFAINNQSPNENNTKQIINITINNNTINLSEIIYSKCNLFDSFIKKTENKLNSNVSSSFTSTSATKINSDNLKLTLISNSLLCILFSSDLNEIYNHLNNISTKFFYSRDMIGIKFLYLNKFDSLLLKLYKKYNKLHSDKKSKICFDFVNLMIDIFLIYYLNEYNLNIKEFCILFDENQKINLFYETVKKNLTIEGNENIDDNENNIKIYKKTIMFLSTLCIKDRTIRDNITQLFNKEIKHLQQKEKTIVNLNDDNILNKNLNYLKMLIKN